MAQLEELNEYSKEYRQILDYTCYFITKYNTKRINLHIKDLTYLRGIEKRLHGTNIMKYITIDGNEETDVDIFLFSLESEDNWKEMLSNMKSNYVLIAARNSMAYKKLLRHKYESINHLKVITELEINNYVLVHRFGLLHPAYIAKSFLALLFIKFGCSNYYFQIMDNAMNNYITRNSVLAYFSYIQLIFAVKKDEYL
jgi:hypothetical protein